jgi:DNA-binding transcriptional ArsR family regulator
MDAVFRAIADPARRALIDALGERDDQTLFELCVRLTGAGMPMSRQAVSKHLSVLREAGVVSTTTRGRTTLHHLDVSALGPLSAWTERTINRSTDRQGAS